MPSECGMSVQLQFSQILFMDLAGYSTLLFDEQRQYQQLTQTVANGVSSVRGPEADVQFFHAFSCDSGLVSIHV